MDLRITTTHGLIGINTTQGKMNIDYGNSSFDINIRNPKIDMNITQPKVEIDQTKPLAEIGQKKIFDFISSNAQKAKQAGLNGISKTVRQGNDLARIETGQSPIPSQAIYNAYGQFIKETNFDLIPKSRPEITLKEGAVDINLEKGEVDIQNRPQKVNLDYNLGKIEVYLKQKPFINVEYIGNHLDFKI